MTESRSITCPRSQLTCSTGQSSILMRINFKAMRAAEVKGQLNSRTDEETGLGQHRRRRSPRLPGCQPSVTASLHCTRVLYRFYPRWLLSVRPGGQQHWRRGEAGRAPPWTHPTVWVRICADRDPGGFAGTQINRGLESAYLKLQLSAGPT